MKENTFPNIIWAIAVAAALLCFNKAHAQVVTNPGLNSRSFQYLTGVLSGSQLAISPTAGTWNAEAPPKYFSLGVTTQATGFQVRLEGSLDNSNWSLISVTSSAIGMVSNPNPIPTLYYRIRAATLSANTSVTATAIGVW